MTDETKRDKIIDAMFDVLPETTAEKIAAKVSRAMRSVISVTDINSAIMHLREHAIHYEWTIPHVPRGKATDENEGRYYGVLVDRAGQPRIDSNPEAMLYFLTGALGTMRHRLTLLRHMATAYRIVIPHIGKRTLKDKLADRAADMDYSIRKDAALIREIEEDLDAQTG